MIIPSLMPEQVFYPKPDDVLSDVSKAVLDEIEGFYQPPMCRFWLAAFVPAGFWPRLICRVATDQQIERVRKEIKSLQQRELNSRECLGGDGFTKLV